MACQVFEPEPYQPVAESLDEETHRDQMLRNQITGKCSLMISGCLPEESPVDGSLVQDDRIFLVVSSVAGDGHDRVDTWNRHMDWLRQLYETTCMYFHAMCVKHHFETMISVICNVFFKTTHVN